jgi:hypothetical protein
MARRTLDWFWGCAVAALLTAAVAAPAFFVLTRALRQ